MFNPNASGVGARRFVEFAQHGGNDMRSLEIEVVLGAIQIRGHRRDELATKLLAVRAAGEQSGDLGDGVGVIGFFQRSREQILFANGLGTVARVDARTAEVQQFLHAAFVRRTQHGRVNQQIVIQEVGRILTVRQDAADFSGDMNDILRLVFLDPAPHGLLISQIKLAATDRENVLKLSRLQSANDRGPDDL